MSANKRPASDDKENSARTQAANSTPSSADPLPKRQKGGSTAQAPLAAAAAATAPQASAACWREYQPGCWALLLEDLIVESNQLATLSPDLLKLLAKAIGATVSGPKKDLAKRIRREAEGVPPGPPLADNLQSLSVGDLKTLLRNRRLPVKGRMLLPRGA